jgi:hypothetical protein
VSFPTVPIVSETKSEVEKLEQRLKDLSVQSKRYKIFCYILLTIQPSYIYNRIIYHKIIEYMFNI